MQREVCYRLKCENRTFEIKDAITKETIVV